MIDSHLSACVHLCCKVSDNPGFYEDGHQHLFPPDECLNCRALASRARHPSNQEQP